MTTRDAERILIAGSGPVGSAAAYLLARRGIPVTVIEAEEGVQLDYRASTFHPPTLDLLEGTGITEALVEHGLKCPTWQFRDRQQGRIAEFDLSVLEKDTNYPYRLQCEQFKLVDYLYGRLDEIDCSEVIFRHRVTGLTQTDDGVTVTCDGPDGPAEFAGKWLIAADGGRSTVRKELGIGFDGYTHPEHFIVAGTEYDFRAHMPDICSVNYTADPVEWYLLLEIPDMWRVIMPVDTSVQADDAITDTYLQNALQNLLPRDGDYPILVRAIYRVSQRIAAEYRKGRSFLAGDAAHINNPLGGMGLNGGLHDALSLTDRLARVWHGEAPESELDGYEVQRRPEAINAINAITERNKKLMEERDPEVRQRNLDEIAAIAADPERAYRFMLNASMITSLRRSGMLAA
ncbi:MAG: NAD(P)/FAD-dependent oxidoreductase [Alphaproteobacteria bacterium]